MKSHRAFRHAYLCGALPLLLGGAVFSLWLVTRWLELFLVGYATIILGLGLFVVGCVALVLGCRSALRAKVLPRRRIWSSVLGAASLLLVNFPVAAALLYTAVAIETSYHFALTNESDREVTDAVLFGGGCREMLGSVAPGTTIECRVWTEQDGQLELEVRVDGELKTIVVEGYVTNMLGGHSSATISADGELRLNGTQ